MSKGKVVSFLQSLSSAKSVTKLLSQGCGARFRGGSMPKIIHTSWHMVGCFVLTVGANLLGCSSSPSKDPPAPKTNTATGTNSRSSLGGGSQSAAGTKVTYDSWAKKYLTENCASSGCHGKGATDPDLSTYAKAKEAAELSLSAMESGEMPKNKKKATTDQIAKMKAWIKDGKLEKEASTSTGKKSSSTSSTGSSSSVGSKSTSSTSATVTWASDIKPIFSKSCGLSSGACHRADTVNSDLTTLESSKPHGQSIKARINSGSMPSGGTLTSTEKQKIATWVDQGMN